MFFQNRISSTESSHDNTDDGVIGHCLHSSDKSLE